MGKNKKEEFKLNGSEIIDKIKELIHQGNIRRITIKNEEEKTLIEITGVCRSEDIAPDNTILSTFISDALIAYNGSGLVNDAAAPGMVTRVLNWLF